MDSSLFGRLPAEMRNRIYELALPQDELISIMATGLRNEPRNFTSVRPIENPLGLVKTCHQIHDETSQLFYHTNTFHFDFGPRFSRRFKAVIDLAMDFLTRLDKNDAKALSSITLTSTELMGDLSSGELPGSKGAAELSKQIEHLERFAAELFEMSPRCKAVAEFRTPAGFLRNSRLHFDLILEKGTVVWDQAIETLKQRTSLDISDHETIQTIVGVLEHFDRLAKRGLRRVPDAPKPHGFTLTVPRSIFGF